MSNKLRKLMAEGPSRIAENKTTKSKLKPKPTRVPAPSVKNDDFITKDIPPEIRESVKMVLSFGIKPDEIKALNRFPGNGKKLSHFVNEIGQNGIDAVSDIANDTKPIQRLKISVISLLNIISKIVNIT